MRTRHRTRRPTKELRLFEIVRSQLLRWRAPSPAGTNGQQNQDIKPVRYALFGAGSAARSHLRDIATKPGVNLVGIADPADAKSWRISDDYATAPRFTDAAKLLEETRPDLVSVCTPTKFHYELTLLAISAGAHVICEKPMAMTVVEAEEMEAARAASGRLGAVNFSYRNLSAFRFARGLITSGNLGRITRVNVVYLQNYRGAPTSIWSWRSDVAIAGFGALGDLGAHMVDTVRFVTGLDFRRVVASAQTLIREANDGAGGRRAVTTDTNAVFLAELTGGVLATFEASQAAAGYADFFRVEVSGDRGTVVVNSEHPDSFQHMSISPRENKTIPMRKVPPKFTVLGPPRSPGAIVQAIRGTQVEFPKFSDGLAVQRVLGALAGSVKSEGWVALH